MATLYVAEFVGTYADHGRGGTAAQQPPTAEQVIAIGGASTQATNALKATTKLIRVSTDAICSIAIGVNPTATATNMRMPANSSEYFAVAGGEKIAVISNV